MKTEIRADGARIAEMRASRFLTAGEFAKVCGVSRPVLDRLESGGPVSYQTAHKVSKALKIPVDELFTAKPRG